MSDSPKDSSKKDKNEQESKAKAELAEPQNNFQVAISQGNSSTLSEITFADLPSPTSYLASITSTISGFVFDESTIAINQSLKLGVDQMQIMANNLIKLSSQAVGSRFLEKSNLLFCDLMVNYGASFFIKRWIDAQTGLFIASFLRQFTDSANYVKIIHKLLTGGVSDAFAEGILIESGYDMIKGVPGFLETPIAKHFIAKPKLMIASATSIEKNLMISALESVHKTYQQAKSHVTSTMVSGLKTIYEADLSPGTPGSSIREGIKAYSSALGSELGLLAGDRVVNRYAGDNLRNSMLEAIDAYFPTARPDSQQKIENRDLLGQHYSVVFNKVEETSKKLLVRKTIKELKKQLSPEILSLLETQFDKPIREALNSLSIPEEIIDKLLTNQPLTDEDYYKIQREKHSEVTVKAAQLTTATWRFGASLASAFSGKVSEGFTALTNNAYTKSQQEELALKLIDDIRLYISCSNAVEEVDIMWRIKEAVKYFSVDSNVKEPTEKNKHFLAKLYQENELGLFVSLIDSVVEKDKSSSWFPSFFTTEKEEKPADKQNKNAKSVACIQLLLHFGVDPSVVVKKMSGNYSDNPQAGVNAIQVAIADIKDERLLNNLINLFLDYNCNFLVPTKLDSETALSIACYKNKSWVVKALLDNLSPNDRLVLCSMKNRYGISALDHATYQSNQVLVHTLLDGTSLSLMGSNALQTLQLAGIEFISDKLAIENLAPLITYPKIEDFNPLYETSRRMMIANLLETSPDSLVENLNGSLYPSYLIRNNNIKDIQYVEHLIQKQPNIKCLAFSDEHNAYLCLKNALVLGTNDHLFDKIFAEMEAYHSGPSKNIIRWHNAVELLNIALEKGNLHIINKLLTMNPSLANCSMNYHKDTPLHVALKSNLKNKEEIFQLLIKHGASVFLQNDIGNSVLEEYAKLNPTSNILNGINNDLLLAFTKLSPDLQKYSKFIVINHVILNDNFNPEHLKVLVNTFTDEDKMAFRKSIGLDLLKIAIENQKPENVLLIASIILPEILPFLNDQAPWDILYLSINSPHKIKLLELATMMIQNHLTPIGFESTECLDLLQKYIELKPENIEMIIEKALNHSTQEENRIADILQWLYGRSMYPEIESMLDKHPNSIHYKPSDSSFTFAKMWQRSLMPNVQASAKKIQTIIDSTPSIESNALSPVVIHTEPKPPVLFTQPSLPRKKSSDYAEDKFNQEVKTFLKNITERYVKAMSDPELKLWGGDIEIEQMGLLLNLNIVVHSENGQIHKLGSEHKNSTTIHLRHQSGNHYVVANPNGKEILATRPNGNCLFEAILLAQKLKRQPSQVKLHVENKEIDELRQQAATALLKIHKSILEGATLSPPGHRGAPVRMTIEQHDPVYIRFNAIFQAKNQEQLDYALAYLPQSALRDAALAIKRSDPSFNREERSTFKPTN